MNYTSSSSMTPGETSFRISHNHVVEKSQLDKAKHQIIFRHKSNTANRPIRSLATYPKWDNASSPMFFELSALLSEFMLFTDLGLDATEQYEFWVHLPGEMGRVQVADLFQLDGIVEIAVVFGHVSTLVDLVECKKNGGSSRTLFGMIYKAMKYIVQKIVQVYYWTTMVLIGLAALGLFVALVLAIIGPIDSA